MSLLDNAIKLLQTILECSRYSFTTLYRFLDALLNMFCWSNINWCSISSRIYHRLSLFPRYTF